MKECNYCYSLIDERASKCPECNEFLGRRKAVHEATKYIGLVSLVVSLVALVVPYLKEAYGYTNSNIIARVVGSGENNTFLLLVSNTGEKPGVISDLSIRINEKVPLVSTSSETSFFIDAGESRLITLEPNIKMRRDSKQDISRYFRVPEVLLTNMLDEHKISLEFLNKALAYRDVLQVDQTWQNEECEIRAYEFKFRGGIKPVNVPYETKIVTKIEVKHVNDKVSYGTSGYVCGHSRLGVFMDFNVKNSNGMSYNDALKIFNGVLEKHRQAQPKGMLK